MIRPRARAGSSSRGGGRAAALPAGLLLEPMAQAQPAGRGHLQAGQAHKNLNTAPGRGAPGVGWHRHMGTGSGSSHARAHWQAAVALAAPRHASCATLTLQAACVGASSYAAYSQQGQC